MTRRLGFVLALLGSLMVVPAHEASAQGCSVWCEECCCFTKQYWLERSGNDVHTVDSCTWALSCGTCGDAFAMDAAIRAIDAARRGRDLNGLVDALVANTRRMRVNRERSTIQILDCTGSLAIGNYKVPTETLDRIAVAVDDAIERVAFANRLSSSSRQRNWSGGRTSSRAAPLLSQ